jgi:hypothetical protein
MERRRRREGRGGGGREEGKRGGGEKCTESESVVFLNTQGNSWPINSETMNPSKEYLQKLIQWTQIQ